MKQIQVRLDDALVGRLERVAPAKARKRSEFIRAAILNALGAEEERRTAEAYARHPDDGAAYFDPSVWEAEKG